MRRDDDADVATLDHGVALLAERALPLAHHLAHLGMAGDDRHGGVDHGLPDLRRHVVAGDRHALAVVELDRILARELLERGHVVEGDALRAARAR